MRHLTASHDSSLTELAPLDWISVMAQGLVAALAVTGLLLWVRPRDSIVESGPT